MYSFYGFETLQSHFSNFAVYSLWCESKDWHRKAKSGLIGQKGTKSVFLNKLSKKSEKTPLNLKTNSNKSRNLGGLKNIGGNAYNNQP